MTAPLDMEALRAALRAMDDEIASLPLMAKMRLTSDASVAIRRLTEARETVELALAELTTRRARDAEVVELVDAAVFALRTRDESGALGDTAEFNLRAALAPFTGAKP